LITRDKDLPAIGSEMKDLANGDTQWQFTSKVGTGSRKEHEEAAKTRQSHSVWGDVTKSSIAPQDLFRVGVYENHFSHYDDRGIPTHDKDGNLLSKALRKKLEKKYEKQVHVYRPQ